LRLDPAFARNLGSLVIMGGAFDHPGNITPLAEANIYHDAQAADVVFASDLPITMVGLNATTRTLLTPEDFERIAASAPKVGGFLQDIHLFYMDFYRSVGFMQGCPMHDATALLACVAPDRFTMQASGLRVICDGNALGQTVADDTRPSVTIAIDVDADWAVNRAIALASTFP